MIIASHFHDQIVAHAGTAVVLVGAGLVTLLAAWAPHERRMRWTVAVLGLAILAGGAYRAAEASAMSHNHLCHAHNYDPCQPHDKHGHTHWFGGRTATPDD